MAKDNFNISKETTQFFKKNIFQNLLIVFRKKIFLKNFRITLNFVFYFSIHKKLNGQKKIQINFVGEKKIGSLKNLLLKTLLLWSERGDFNSCG
jgi:hypothetical protein